jgi:hypothetical protein
MITDERKLLEGDRHLFHQWWQSLKDSQDAPNKFTFDQQSTLQVDTSRQSHDHNDQHNDNLELDRQRLYTFKRVDNHDDLPARSPMNGRVDPSVPQANQQIINIAQYTYDNFPTNI